MINENKNQTDWEQILATRYDNGADFWATPDGRLGIEKPISTLTALMIISELNVPRDHKALQGAAELVLTAIRDDGRVRIAPKGAIYPCHTAHAVTGLCRNGYACHPRVQAALDYLLADRYEDGGWRCNKFIYGHGPETDKSNPGVTLLALDAFRLAGFHAQISVGGAEDEGEKKAEQDGLDRHLALGSLVGLHFSRVYRGGLRPVRLGIE